MNIRQDYSHLFSSLSKLGLSDSEIVTYLSALWCRAPQTSGILAKRSGLKRSTALANIQTLVDQGLLKRVRNSKAWYYAATPPDRLLQILSLRKAELQAVEKELLESLPELKNIGHDSVDPPIVEVYEGLPMVRAVFSDLLAKSEELLSLFSFSQREEPSFGLSWLDTFETPDDVPKKMRLIVPDSAHEEAFQKLEVNKNCEIRLAPDSISFESEKHIMGHAVVRLVFRGDLIFATVTEDPEIAASERANFDLLWQLLEK